MSERRDNVIRLAEAVADGTLVEWDETPDSSQRGLRALERISQECRADSFGATHLPGGSDPASVGNTLPRWGKLHLVERLATGGFGEVFRAHDPTLQRDVALKLLRPDRLSETAGRRFIDEARRLARVHHPNVVVVHGADEHEGRIGLWTDLLEGKTLEQCLDEQGTFSSEEAITVGTALCQALAAVHGAGLVHGDVKTANAMRAIGGRYVLLDFSSAQRMRTPRARDDRVSISGTPLFMAPELFRGAQAGVRSDIYALGVVLYRLVSGRYPVEATSFAELTEKHRRGASLPLRDARADLPIAFVQTVERALSADADNRFASAGEFEKALLTGDPRPQPSPRPERRSRPAPPPWRRAAGWAAVAAAVALSVYAGWEVYRWFSPPSLELSASFFRMDAAGEERLEPGDQIRPGDHLFLDLGGSREMYVYVLNEDDLGQKYLLFPLPGLELINPLAADVRHRLPGALAGQEQYWEVSSAGGREFLLIIASVEPLDALQEALRRVPPAAPGGPLGARLDDEVVPRLRGIGRIAPAQPSPDGAENASLRSLAEALGILAANEKTLRLQRLELENPR